MTNHTFKSCLLGVALALTLTAPALAQTPIALLSFPAEWGAVSVEAFVEVDGRPETLDVMVWSLNTFQWRVVSVQPSGGWCVSPWFYWGGDMWIFPHFRKVNGTDRAYATTTLGDGSSMYLEFAIDMPPCP